jgi:prepilin-type N-terminal cleavage/methylation domain-containing protein
VNERTAIHAAGIEMKLKRKELAIMRAATRGFTLIEIAIVLVIIGLLLGGVLKGEELIRAARVRNIISEEQGIKAAFYGFQDRFRALPGDYASASTNMNCGATTCVDGDGNGRIEAPNGASLHEEIMLWTHLTAAGFINGSYNATVADTAPTDANNPKNAYSIYLQVAYDNNYGNGTPPNRHNLKTGGQIPVELIAEVDRQDRRWQSVWRVVPVLYVYAGRRDRARRHYLRVRLQLEHHW